jgi:hypothetical protein
MSLAGSPSARVLGTTSSASSATMAAALLTALAVGGG